MNSIIASGENLNFKRNSPEAKQWALFMESINALNAYTAEINRQAAELNEYIETLKRIER